MILPPNINSGTGNVVDATTGLTEQIVLHETDDSEVKVHYFHIDGVLHGEYKQYHVNGNPHTECVYVNGLLEGVCLEYFPNGNLHKRTIFKSGKRHGLDTQYSLSGEILTIITYRDGRFHGANERYHGGKLAERRFMMGYTNITEKVQELASDINNITAEEKLIIGLKLGLYL